MEDKKCPDCPVDLNCDAQERQKRYQLMTRDRYRYVETVEVLEKIREVYIYYFYAIAIVLVVLLWRNHTKAAIIIAIPSIIIFYGSLMLIPIVQYILRVKPACFPPPCSAIINLNPRWTWLCRRIKLVQKIRLIFLFTWISFFIWFLFTLSSGKMIVQLAGMITCAAAMFGATIYEYKLKK